MKCCQCPNCKKHQELIPQKISKLVREGAVSRFVCDSCGYATQIVAEKQGKDRVILFFAMAEVEECGE